jgi:hypothetical protein
LRLGAEQRALCRAGEGGRQGRRQGRIARIVVNRDGPDDAHGARLDAFFHEELAYEPSYRRIFRSPERGSVVIDLLDPVRD